LFLKTQTGVAGMKAFFKRQAENTQDITKTNEQKVSMIQRIFSNYITGTFIYKISHLNFYMLTQDKGRGFVKKTNERRERETNESITRSK
jgi:hypothetical protein